MTDEQIAKLPKQAQAYITALTRRAEDAEKRLAEVTGTEPTVCYQRIGRGSDARHVYLNPDKDVLFGVGEDESGIAVCMKGKALHVRVQNGTMSVRPCSANVVEIYNEGWS
jgi:hypothetical protein